MTEKSIFMGSHSMVFNGKNLALTIVRVCKAPSYSRPSIGLCFVVWMWLWNTVDIQTRLRETIATGVRSVCGWGRPRSQEFLGQKPANHQNQGSKVLNLREILQGLLSLQRSLWAAVFLLCWQELCKASVSFLEAFWSWQVFGAAQQVSGWIGSHYTRAAHTGWGTVKPPRGELGSLPCSSWESTAAFPSFSSLVQQLPSKKTLRTWFAKYF